MSNKKILFITMDATKIGGIEKSLSNLLPKLIENKSYDIDLISCFREKLVTHFDYGLNNIIYLSNEGSNFISGAFINKVKNYFILMKIIKKLNFNKYDKIISMYPIISILILLFNPKCSSKTYAWEHSQLSGHSIVLNLIRFLFYRFVKKIIVLTLMQKNKYKYLNKNIEIIPNIVNNSNIKINNNKSNNFHIIGIGRLSYEKGFDRFVNILNILKCIRTDWYATIYGDGDEYINLIKLIDKFELNDYITIKKNVIDPQVIYGDADLLAMCSRSEVFGMVIIESMQVGLPIVAYDDGEGPKELIKNKINGIIINSLDQNDFIKSIIELMENKEYYSKISYNAKITGKKYESSSIIKKWEILLNE